MDKLKVKTEEWKNSNIQVFWGEIAPLDHVIQIYDAEKYFMDTLEGFAGCGLISGESVVIIAVDAHLQELYRRLQDHGFNMEEKIKNHEYIPIDAHVALEKFMVNNWPDNKLFNEFISSVLEQAQHNKRKVRAFGEMVAVLWQKGLNGATVHLESLWHQLHSKDAFTLYCAYPKSGFTQNIKESIEKICQCHSMIIDGQSHPTTEIYYRGI